jgi:hypothetical protein
MRLPGGIPFLYTILCTVCTHTGEQYNCVQFASILARTFVFVKRQSKEHRTKEPGTNFYETEKKSTMLPQAILPFTG